MSLPKSIVALAITCVLCSNFYRILILFIVLHTCTFFLHYILREVRTVWGRRRLHGHFGVFWLVFLVAVLFLWVFFVAFWVLFWGIFLDFCLGFFVVCLVWFWSVVFCFGGGFFVGWSGFFGFCLFLVAFSPLGRRC